jgi:sodium-dependent dicarboxylate transporter 2/3/5
LTDAEAPASPEELRGDGRFKPVAVALGPALFVLALLVRPGGLEGAALRTLAVTLWVAAWWVTEAIPIAATSLLPLVLLPLCRIKTAKEVAGLYVEDLLILLLGGFLLALAIERWGLHRRIALFVLKLLGGAPRRLVLGFALAAGLISMWISNSGTTLVLLPIALAVSRRLAGDLDPESHRRFDRAILLAIAYGATAGGFGTYVGTPPNLIFRERYAQDFRAGEEGGPPELSFLQWMLCFAPFALVLAAIVGLVLARGLPRVDGGATREAVRREAAALPPWSLGERLVALLFAAAALLWITREPIEFGDAHGAGGTTLFGWARLWGEKKPWWISDATVAMAITAACFVIRAPPAVGMAAPPGTRTVPLLEWSEAERKMPWGILLLFGAGFALGDAFSTSGLSLALGTGLARSLAGMPGWVVLLGIALFVIVVTEFMNNTACAQVLLPILSSMARSLGLAPAALLLTGTIAASCGFMMPAGTAPNAIVFATRRIRIGEMVRVGLLLDVIAALLVTGWIVLVALPMLGIPLTAP